jgi:hypothetical protein
MWLWLWNYSRFGSQNTSTECSVGRRWNVANSELSRSRSEWRESSAVKEGGFGWRFILNCCNCLWLRVIVQEVANNSIINANPVLLVTKPPDKWPYTGGSYVCEGRKRGTGAVLMLCIGHFISEDFMLINKWNVTHKCRALIFTVLKTQKLLNRGASRFGLSEKNYVQYWPNPLGRTRPWGLLSL